ncbi:MAG: hypothetical protein K8U03_20230 [Planctomycetia bacterium]|nr:hypothetical protein [Planctomycetia bacterium]
MLLFYSLCAVLGCTVLACQFLLTVTGVVDADDIDSGDVGGHDGVDHSHGDPNHAHGSSWFFGMLTLRTVTAALAFFGLTGLAMNASDVAPIAALAIASAAGVASLYFVHWMMRSLSHLKAEGTVRIKDAVGTVGSVYIPIPAGNAGPGKVQIMLQGRTVELSAMTEHAALPTGARIVVTKVIGPDAVEVTATETH